MEVELKLLLDAKAAKALRLHPLLKEYATAESQAQKLAAIYYDTPKLDIRRCNASLRVRQVDDRWMQTMKAGGNVQGGMHSRDEWESEVRGPAIDASRLHEVAFGNAACSKLLRSRQVVDQLSPVFTTRVDRTVWMLGLPQGTQVECVLDQGIVEREGKKVPISELELELKSGSEIGLIDFALTLLNDIPMRLGALSKADRGYMLFQPQSSVAVKAKPLKLSRRMSVEEAFRAIISNCIEHVQANEAQVVAGRNEENLHQMRVGLRRLRSALGLFEEVVQLPAALADDLDWLASQLGAARDWDVLAGSTLPAIAGKLPDPVRVKGVRDASHAKALQKHEAAAGAVDSMRYTRLILSLARWLRDSDARSGMLPEKRAQLAAPVTQFACGVLEHCQRRLRKRGKRLEGASAPTRHRVRIAAKKARYATEFFQSLYPKKKVNGYVDALAAMQEELGWLNDVAVATPLLKEIQTETGGLAADAGFLEGFLAASVEGEDRKIRKLWKNFEQMDLPC